MKRILFVLLDLLSVAFLIGGYVIQYFTKRKLGMSRWVVFKVSKWQNAMPLDLLKYVAVIVLLLLTIMVIGSYMRKREKIGKIDTGMMVVMAIFTVVYLGFTLFANSEMIRSYYLVMPMIGVAALLQVIRSGIAVWMCRNEK